MKVALLHNPKPSEAPADLPDDVFEEYDGEETITAIACALRGLEVLVEPVVADCGLARALETGGFAFAFNIAEGKGGRNREAVAAAVCELFGVPHTGSDAMTLAVTLDKWTARRVVSPEVPVTPAVLVRSEGDEHKLKTLRYPAIVKPNAEGSSMGIRDDAVVDSAVEAWERVQTIRLKYGGAALVEEFLPGAEITVGVVGNGSDGRVLGTMEIAPTDVSDRFVYSLEVKRDFRRRVEYHIPPRLSADGLMKVTRLALSAYELLGCRDVARMDFRLNAAGEPFFLECNPLPGLNPESGDIVILSRGVCRYEELVQQIFLNALQRTGVRLR